MVHRQENKGNTLPQFRDEEEPRAVGRLPHVGETIGRKEPPYQAVGIAALSPLFSKVSFPATKDELKARIGQAVVPVSRWRTSSVAEILDKTGPGSFSSVHELTSAIDRVWDTIAPEDAGGRGGNHHRRA